MKLNKTRSIYFICVLLLVSTGCFRRTLDESRLSRDLRIKNPYQNKVLMPFQLINNLVVIPVRINNSDTLKFILDTGASRTLITELGVNQEFQINYADSTNLRGLGRDGIVKALLSYENEIFLSKIEGKNHSVVLLLESILNLSAYMGIQVNGLIGYDIFKNFTVEIDYQKGELTFFDPNAFNKKYQSLKKSRRWTHIPLEIDNNKFYMNVSIMQSDSSVIDTKLLVDSGASHNIFLYKNSSDSIIIPDKTVYSYLGSGINGEIYGEIGRARKILIDDLELFYPVISYPENQGLEHVEGVGERNGSIGADFLKRFKVIFNYSDSSMLIRPNRAFDDDFVYNTSGLEILSPVSGIPYYIVSNIRPNSPAQEVGIEKGDILVKVNRKKVYRYTLNDLFKIFQSADSNEIKISVRRDSEIIDFNLKIKDETKLEGQS